jgi:Methyltransferase domain
LTENEARLLDLDSMARQLVALMERRFPERFHFIEGDSRQVPPNWQVPCDAIFADGGHDYDVAAADIRNMAKNARSSRTVLIVDDICERCINAGKIWMRGPTRAWPNQLLRRHSQWILLGFLFVVLDVLSRGALFRFARLSRGRLLCFRSTNKKKVEFRCPKKLESRKKCKRCLLACKSCCLGRLRLCKLER